MSQEYDIFWKYHNKEDMDKYAVELIENQAERIEELESLLDEIEAVSCGEEQIESDGVYDDSDGLLWIYKRIQTLKGG